MQTLNPKSTSTLKSLVHCESDAPNHMFLPSLVRKEEFEMELWLFEQLLEQAVFVIAGCPYQVRNLQTVIVDFWYLID
ncbi:hypothetical protein Patl1_19259 [Pistacia atlantica]|uniref:Uncharacterized protein n=1 Tax=Pistacia atlantica TaxID=434234 RepID=A0ACC1C1J1_9ROSI|nr:hypothetical protein Patl1_19259 [Pistacia atlantica]